MLKLIAQFTNHHGPTRIGEHKITFTIQPELSSELYNILERLNDYPQVVVNIELVGAKDKKESRDELWTRHNKKIHALFDDLAHEKKVSSESVKTTIKSELSKKGVIKTSLKELNVDQQLSLISDLENMIIDVKFSD